MREFLRSTLASFLGILLALGFVLFALSTLFLAEPASPIPHRCVLVLDSQVETSDAGLLPPLGDLLTTDAKPTIALQHLVDGIEKAARDPRIEGILLHGFGQYHGFAALRAVQKALLDFRAQGKPIYAYAEDYQQADYYLASTASWVGMAPMGVFDFSGLAAEMEFYGELLQKVGIEVQVSRVGKYKSAVEPFLLSAASEENKEQVRELLQSLQQTYFADVAKAREMSVEELQHAVEDTGLFSAEEALQQGFLDQVAYFDEVLALLNHLVGDGEEDAAFAQVGLRRYLETLESTTVDNSEQPVIAVLYAEGEIVDGASDWEIGGDSLAAQIRNLRQDPKVAGVVLRINSPGGSASASEVILRELQLLQQADKALVVSMGPVAASGGYWIACQADQIFAEPNTITGSIGVFGMFPNVQPLMKNIGVHVDVVKTGPHANWMSFYQPKPKEELDLIQSYIDQVYDGFLQRVAGGRKMSKEEVHAIAQGRVWTGAQALELGLVDELGNLQQALERCAELAQVEADHVRYPESQASVLEQWLAMMLAGQDQPVAGWTLSALPLHLQLAVKTFQTRAAQPGVYARLPFSLRIR